MPKKKRYTERDSIVKDIDAARAERAELLTSARVIEKEMASLEKSLRKQKTAADIGAICTEIASRKKEIEKKLRRRDNIESKRMKRLSNTLAMWDTASFVPEPEGIELQPE